MEQVLSGGNMHERIVRIGETVRRPTGPWTPGVHALLAHLEREGFSGAPRVHGIDEQGREVLDYIEGDVVHPDHLELVQPDTALAEIARLIRGFHDAASGFDAGGFAWAGTGADPRGPYELLCHNDLAPWNLIHAADGRWVFIDWDIAAPGRLSWELAWAVVSFVPLMPENALPPERILERIATFRDNYGPAEFPRDILAVAVERCRYMAERIDRLGAAGEEPYARLLVEGHATAWHAAAAHIEKHAGEWELAV